MIRILTGVKVRHAPCGAILRQKTASKGSKGSDQPYTLPLALLLDKYMLASMLVAVSNGAASMLLRARRA